LPLSIRFDAKLSQSRGVPRGALLGVLGALPFGLGVSPFGLGAMFCGLSSIEILQVGPKRLAARADDREIVSTFPWLKPDADARTDEPVHLGNRFQAFSRS